eukprot:2824740-Rhodomonas_salina.1
MKVVEQIEQNEAEQEFLTDCAAVVAVSLTGLIRRWPRHTHLISILSNSFKAEVGYVELKAVDPQWHAFSLRAFLEHYSRYHFMRPENTPRADSAKYSYLTPNEGGATGNDLKLCDAVDELEKRVAVLLRTPVPTPGEKVLMEKQLKSQLPGLARARDAGAQGASSDVEVARQRAEQQRPDTQSSSESVQMQSVMSG